MLPWSFEWQLKAFALNFPAELLIAILGLSSLVISGEKKWKKTFFSVGLSFIGIGGFLVCVSTMPLVSFKHLLIDFAHFWVFALFFARYWEHWSVLLRIFAISMAIFVLYALFRHAGYHFRADQAMLTPMPFFQDHNGYSAVLVATFFAYWGFCERKWFDFGVLGLFALGILLAGSRAAYVSFLFGLIVLGWVTLARRYSFSHRIHLLSLFLALVSFITATFLFREKIYAYVRQDVSLAERINRYKCAWRMAEERPMWGFGAGTYQFKYLAFQKEADLTRISVHQPAYRRHVHMYGRGGGPHSEYLGALAEHGWPGLLLKLILTGAVFFFLIKEIKKTEHADNQHVPLGIFICITTIALHGLVNDLSHDARIAALIWGSLAYQFMSSSSFLRLRGASSS